MLKHVLDRTPEKLRDPKHGFGAGRISLRSSRVTAYERLRPIARASSTLETRFRFNHF